MNIQNVKFGHDLHLGVQPFRRVDYAEISFTAMVDGGSLEGKIKVDKDEYLKNAIIIETYLSNKIASQILGGK